MTLLSLLCLQGALLGGPTKLQLTGDLQLRGGYSNSLYVIGADSAPPLNLPSSNRATWQWNMILTPGAALSVRFPRFTLVLGYQPRLFLDVRNPGNVPRIFHRLNLDTAYGREKDWLLSVGAAMSVGGLDYGQAGALFQQFAPRPGSEAASAAQFFSVNGYTKLKMWFGRSWSFETAEEARKISLQGSDSGTLARAAAVETPATGLILQGQEQLATKNTVRYRLNEAQGLKGGLDLSYLHFSGTSTYVGVQPTFGWEGELGKLTRMSASAGVFRVWQSEYAGVVRLPQYQAVFDVSVSHTFADVGLPRLAALASVSEAPYADPFLGELVPRGVASAAVTYDFTRQIAGSLNFRDFTQLYPGREIRRGRDKNVASVGAQVKYKYASWVSYTGGILYLERWLIPTKTSPLDHRRDFFFFLGATGSYDVE